ncbi:MAG: 23S rRNA (pseudouridine(1915)-N(3))-methyltransferase RlmH [Eubacteriales bacterium]|nr:23S rRNA (pseudouridine(1915)-N(3))-methyltransferase RlmH [Eubacteriales bacterium]
MNVEIICIGKLKEKYWRDASAEYAKRLGRFCRFKITELKESRLPENASAADEETVKHKEGEEILKALKKQQYVVALDIRGTEIDSEKLAARLDRLMTSGTSDVAFIIGGSLGLSQDVISRADFRLSFSPMTFPHQMMRIILQEQLYRCFKIIHNEAYHK